MPSHSVNCSHLAEGILLPRWIRHNSGRTISDSSRSGVRWSSSRPCNKTQLLGIRTDFNDGLALAVAAEEAVVLQQTGEPERTGRVKSYWEQNFTGGINRTAYYTEGSNSWTVWEYSSEDDGVAYVVQDGRCAYYCSQTNLQCNLEDSLCSYDYMHSAKFAGNFDGQNCFVWSDNLGPIPMNVQSICINGTTPVPVSGTR